MTSKVSLEELLQSEINRCKLVFDAWVQAGEKQSAAVLAYKIRMAERWLWWGSRGGMEKSLRELEVVK